MNFDIEDPQTIGKRKFIDAFPSDDTVVEEKKIKKTKIECYKEGEGKTKKKFNYGIY